MRRPIAGFAADRRGVRRQIELESARDHDDGLQPVSIFEPGELQGLVAVDEQTAATTALIPHDPFAATIPADEEDDRLPQEGR